MSLKFACRKVPLSTFSPANEVPPRRGRDLTLLPHVLSYLGTPRQAWNEVQPIATPDAGANAITGIPGSRADVTGIKFGPFLAYNPVPR